MCAKGNSRYSSSGKARARPSGAGVGAVAAEGHNRLQATGAKMVNIPKVKKAYCKDPKCRKHTPHKVTQYKTGKASLYAQGKRRYDSKQSGYGGQTKPVFHKKAKTTKKIVLRLACQVRNTHTNVLRAKQRRRRRRRRRRRLGSYQRKRERESLGRASWFGGREAEGTRGEAGGGGFSWESLVFAEAPSRPSRPFVRVLETDRERSSRIEEREVLVLTQVLLFSAAHHRNARPLVCSPSSAASTSRSEATRRRREDCSSRRWAFSNGVLWGAHRRWWRAGLGGLGGLGSAARWMGEILIGSRALESPRTPQLCSFPRAEKPQE